MAKKVGSPEAILAPTMMPQKIKNIFFLHPPPSQLAALP